MTAHDAMFRLLGVLPEATRARMARMYRDSLAQLVPQLGEAVAAGDVERTRTSAHKIAGAAAMMQDEALSTPTRRMEQLILDGTPEDAFALWAAVRVAADESMAALDAAFA